jgi:hypothetical protein
MNRAAAADLITADPSPLLRVAYRDAPAIGIKVNIIKCWVRGEITGPTSAPTIRNDVLTLFNDLPGAARVVMLRGEYRQSRPFLLVENRAGQFFDMKGKEVVVEAAAAA